MATVTFSVKDFGGRSLDNAELRFIPSEPGVTIRGDLLAGPAITVDSNAGSVYLEPSGGIATGSRYTLVIVWRDGEKVIDWQVFPRQIILPQTAATVALTEIMETLEEDADMRRSQCLIEVSSGTTNLDNSRRPIQDFMRLWIDTSKTPMVLMQPESEV